MAVSPSNNLQDYHVEYDTEACPAPRSGIEIDQANAA